jgi:hypothetical protein
MAARKPFTAALLALLAGLTMSTRATADAMLIDDFTGDDGRSELGTPWRLFTDGVMGGVSTGRMTRAEVGGRSALCLEGDVRLENNGGFVQLSLDLAPAGTLDASGYTGVRLVVSGNGEPYGLHLKTADVRRPWQSYRAGFTATAAWREVRLPFAEFAPYRLDAPLDTARLTRLGLVAIGRAFAAELCVAEIGLY